MGQVHWVCVPGLVQLAVCWYKTGRREAANVAMQWVEQRQEASGGFRGSWGPEAWYLPSNEPAWAVKYYLDAHMWRTFCAREVEVLAPGVVDGAGRTELAKVSL